jgi:hypothetical protein
VTRSEFGNRCALPCGLRDSVLKNGSGGERGEPCQHYCVLVPRGHHGPCDFIGPCGRSLESRRGSAVTFSEIRGRPCRHGGHGSASAALACLNRYGVPGFEVLAIPGLEE